MDISLVSFSQFFKQETNIQRSQNPVPFNELRSVSRVLHKRQADLGDVPECHPPRGRCQAPTAHCFFSDHIWPSKDQVPHLFCSFMLTLAVEQGLFAANLCLIFLSSKEFNQPGTEAMSCLFVDKITHTPCFNFWFTCMIASLCKAILQAMVGFSSQKDACRNCNTIMLWLTKRSKTWFHCIPLYDICLSFFGLFKKNPLAFIHTICCAPKWSSN